MRWNKREWKKENKKIWKKEEKEEGKRKEALTLAREYKEKCIPMPHRKSTNDHYLQSLCEQRTFQKKWLQAIFISMVNRINCYIPFQKIIICCESLIIQSRGVGGCGSGSNVKTANCRIIHTKLER